MNQTQTKMDTNKNEEMEYVEEPHVILESYFNGQHLERLVRHQTESYNHFVNYQIQKSFQFPMKELLFGFQCPSYQTK